MLYACTYFVLPCGVVLNNNKKKKINNAHIVKHEGGAGAGSRQVAGQSVLIICPIAIAYSMGQIIKSVCVCLSVCPSASTLTVVFLNRFSPKFAQT